VAVSPDLYTVIEESLLYSRLSGGKFDITVAPLVDAWKAAMNGGPRPTPAEEMHLRACVGYQKVGLIPPSQVRFDSPCMRLDLGAIGKGYAVDRVAAILRSAGINSALIDAGGSTLYAIGAPPDKPGWTVQLSDPSSKVDPRVTLLDNSVSTSQQTPRDLISKGASGHVVDPPTGAPTGEVSAVSVVAPTATAADALSTTLLLLGPVRGKSVAAGLAGVSAVWVSPQGEVVNVSGVTPILVKGGAHTTARAANR
jgi:FAD:protein FMN transferase